MDTRIQALHPRILPTNKKNNSHKTETGFKDFLNQQHQLKISKHAQERMNARNIKVSDQKWDQVLNKLSEANQKGVKDSLIILDNAAFIVNAQNKTVITAMEKTEMTSKIITNINGTILID